jgi:hypothetical protein
MRRGKARQGVAICYNQRPAPGATTAQRHFRDKSVAWRF